MATSIPSDFLEIVCDWYIVDIQEIYVEVDWTNKGMNKKKNKWIVPILWPIKEMQDF